MGRNPPSSVHNIFLRKKFSQISVAFSYGAAAVITGPQRWRQVFLAAEAPVINDPSLEVVSTRPASR